MTSPAWLDLIPVRHILERDLEARFPLPPGDRPLVIEGSPVGAGDPLLEHLRDRRIEEIDVHPASGAERPLPGSRWSPVAGRRRRRDADIEGELLTILPGRKDRWRLVTADHRDIVPSPLTGDVVEVRPGAEIRVRAAGAAIRGALAAGTAAHGRLELATDQLGELRPGGIDVSKQGSILVVGARIDAEALTRARAMGVRGVVVASLPGKELRDFQASEKRQRSALHPNQPFGVLALEGAMRRSLPVAVAALFERLAGRQVALLVDPPALAFEDPDVELPPVAPDHVRIRGGVNAGLEGRVVGLAGLRRYPPGIHLEAAWVTIDGEPPIDVPLGDLERLG
ncbi:MAG: hypothetical protein WCK58_06210 [Chloroflexota bacterium]